MKTLETLKLWQKFALVVTVLGLPILGLTYLLIAEKNISIEFAEKEQIGVEYLLPLTDLFHNIAEHRSTTNFVLNGENSFRELLDQQKVTIARGVAAVNSVNELYGDQLQTSEKWEALKNEWQALMEITTQQTTQDNFDQHTQILTTATDLIHHVADTSNLILDPNLDSYYLMDSTVTRIPSLLGNMGILRSTAASGTVNGGLAEQEFMQLINLIGQLNITVNSTVRSMGIAFAHNPDLEPLLGAPMNTFSSASTRFIDLVNDEVINVTEITASADEITSAGSEAIAASLALYAATIPALSDLLERRIDRFSGNQLTTLGLIALSLVLVFALVYWIIRIILIQLGGEPDQLRQVAEAIARGDLSNKQADSSQSVSGVFAAMQAMQQKLDQVIEQDIANLVDSVRCGDLDQRINLDGKSGFYAKLSSGINDLVEVNEQIVKDTANVFAAMARGDLTTTIETEYQGSFDQLKQNANATIKTLSDVIEHDIQEIVNSARAGDLSQRIPLEGKAGFYQELSSGVNELVDAADRVIGDASRVLGAMAAGELTQTVKADYQGSFGQLKQDINTTVEKFANVVADISRGANEVLSGAQEIAQGNLNLSQRTEEQAASLQETASSMEEMTSTVGQNADNTRQADQLSTEAREQAERGGEVVNSAISAMGEITTSSNKIAEIIEVINEIAFQTNLLALNAAVEAARAGEQGRGFAVVASEVRNLAQRSASASKDIKDLIEDSVNKVEEGSRLVNQSGEMLGEINVSVKKVSDIIAEISAAGQEQSAGIEQVNKAISQMDEMTQQNAALVEQAAAASESVGDQAAGLNQLISFFTTDGQSGVAAEPYVAKPVFVEKRAADRPWKETPTAAPATDPVTSNTPANKVAAAGGDEEWEEF